MTRRRNERENAAVLYNAGILYYTVGSTTKAYAQSPQRYGRGAPANHRVSYAHCYRDHV